MQLCVCAAVRSETSVCAAGLGRCVMACLQLACHLLHHGSSDALHHTCSPLMPCMAKQQYHSGGLHCRGLLTLDRDGKGCVAVAGNSTAWLFPFVDGHPPIGWEDASRYLLLPVLLVRYDAAPRSPVR